MSKSVFFLVEAQLLLGGLMVYLQCILNVITKFMIFNAITHFLSCHNVDGVAYEMLLWITGMLSYITFIG